MPPSSRRRAAAAAAAAAAEADAELAVAAPDSPKPAIPEPPSPTSSSISPPASSNKQRRISLVLVVLACVLLVYRVVSTFQEIELTDKEPPVGGLSVKRATAAAEKGSEGDSPTDPKLKVTLDQSGWSPQIGSLVDKRPPRPCTKTEIAVQMFDLIVIHSGKKPPQRVFACLSSTAKCREALLEEALDRQWKPAKSGGIDATIVFTDFAALAKLPPPTFAKLYFGREGSSYLDVVYGGLALNTLDSIVRFSELQAYTKQFGCEVNDLQVMLGQYRVHDETECLQIRALAQKTSRSTYVIKGSSMGAEQLLSRLGDCISTTGGPAELVTQPLGKPMLLNGKEKFFVRGFCLVGSTMPFMVFFRRGFVVTEAGKQVSLEQFQRTLANGKITGTHFIDTFLQTSMKQIAMYVFQASRQSFLRRRGSFQIFSLDFVVSEEMKIYLDSTNPHPIVPQNIVTDMLDLVMELGEEPGAFSTMLTGDKYGSFELIFSELRETCEGAASFNPCQQFKQYNTQNLAKANKKISVTHNAFNREHHEETRVVKKLEEEKKQKCKEKGFSLESKSCDKYAKTLEEEEFETLFALHEKDWNPNAFKLAQPGEVFAWEIV